jgi:hypothetical protein
MVHALKEIWRVLVPHGWLLDVRPLSANAPLEIVAGTQVWRAGRVDEAAGLPDDHAANESLQTIVREGWFIHERKAHFDYAWYWDTLDELQTHIAEKWSNSMQLPTTVETEAARLLTDGGTEARVRLRLTLTIARYRKSLSGEEVCDEQRT